MNVAVPVVMTATMVGVVMDLNVRNVNVWENL